MRQMYVTQWVWLKEKTRSTALQSLPRPSSLFKLVFGLSQFKAHLGYIRTQLRHANSSLSSTSHLFPVYMRGMARRWTEARPTGSSPLAPWRRGPLLSEGCLLLSA